MKHFQHGFKNKQGGPGKGGPAKPFRGGPGGGG